MTKMNTAISSSRLLCFLASLNAGCLEEGCDWDCCHNWLIRCSVSGGGEISFADGGLDTGSAAPTLRMTVTDINDEFSQMDEAFLVQGSGGWILDDELAVDWVDEVAADGCPHCSEYVVVTFELVFAADAEPGIDGAFPPIEKIYGLRSSIELWNEWNVDANWEQGVCSAVR